MIDDGASAHQPGMSDTGNAPSAAPATPIRQLDSIIESLATHAAPVLRDIAAKAAEAAGPMGQRAAAKT